MASCHSASERPDSDSEGSNLKIEWLRRPTQAGTGSDSESPGPTMVHSQLALVLVAASECHSTRGAFFEHYH